MSTTRYIVMNGNLYQTPRRATNTQYESRSGWSENMDDARIYQNKAAASRSKLGGEVVAVTLTIKQEL